MISTYLGEDVFMAGIRLYLKEHAYGNTQTGDLWAALSTASGKDVRKVMDIWTKNVGYPVITVTENDDKSIHVKQNRFLRTADVKPEEDQILYPVFLSLRTKDGIDETLTLTEREKSFPLANNDFFKLNADHTNIYRTSYTPERLKKLGEAAKGGLLTVEDRAGMIADAGALATSGYQKTSGVLNLLKGFNSETEFVVWNEIITRLAAIQGAWVFEDPKVKESIEIFTRELVSEKAHKAGWEFKESDGHIEQQFKAMLFGSAGLAGDKVIIDAAKDMFAKFSKGDHSAIHPNIRGSVFAMVLKYGGVAEVSFLTPIPNQSIANQNSTTPSWASTATRSTPTSATPPSALSAAPRTPSSSSAPSPSPSATRSRSRTSTCPSARFAPPPGRPLHARLHGLDLHIQLHEPGAEGEG
jgi:aminopeptidase 2